MIFIVQTNFILLDEKTNLNSIKKVCENKDLCNVITPSEEKKILEFNQYQKTDTTPLLFMLILNVWWKRLMD